ncbi:MAG TPA: zf-HC2 domain-containing protein [Thermoanaerobaculia bacterium]|nr:zf-HC2 domain-containing protein [Thermoanaerobaculia bacterium]
MKCEEFITFLADYLDGELPPETVERFQRHLDGCRSCTAYLATYRETILMARGVVGVELTEVPEELIEAVLGSFG